MSATQLAAFIAACLLTGGLVALATLVVWKLHPHERNAAPGVLALCLGVLACVVFGLGASIAVRNPNAPSPANSSIHGCQAGTYDNGSNSDGPKCIPWPVEWGR